MTIHTFYHYECEACGKAFIPYKRNMICPSCGATTEEYYDFISISVDSLKYNLKRYDSFMPGAWNIQGIVVSGEN